jgi:hypothetical protein
MTTIPPDFPAVLEIDYPEQELNWLTTFFRPFLTIPIMVVLATDKYPPFRLAT